MNNLANQSWIPPKILINFLYQAMKKKSQSRIDEINDIWVAKLCKNVLTYNFKLAHHEESF